MATTFWMTLAYTMMTGNTEQLAITGQIAHILTSGSSFERHNIAFRSTPVGIIATQLEAAALVLRSLHGLSVLQLLPDGDARLGLTGLPRYNMHLLVRELAADIRQQQRVDEQNIAVSNFVGFNLSSCKPIMLSHSSLTTVPHHDAAVAAKHLQLETPNIHAMRQLLAADCRPRFCTMLEENSEQARIVAPICLDSPYSAMLEPLHRCPVLDCSKNSNAALNMLQTLSDLPSCGEHCHP